MPAVFVHRSFALLWSARVLSTLAFHVQAVAVGWQLYELTGSALDLGLVGLVQFVPMALLTLAAGQAADRYDRRGIVIVCQIVKAAAAAVLAFGTSGGWLGRESILATLPRATPDPRLRGMISGRSSGSTARPLRAWRTTRRPRASCARSAPPAGRSVSGAR